MKTAQFFLISIFLLVASLPKNVLAGGVTTDNRSNWFFETIPYNVTFNSTWNPHVAVSDPIYDSSIKGPYGYLAAPYYYVLGQSVTVKLQLRNDQGTQRTTRGFLAWFRIPDGCGVNTAWTDKNNITSNSGINKDPGIDEYSLLGDSQNRGCQTGVAGSGSGNSGTVPLQWTIPGNSVYEVSFTFTPTQAGYYQYDVALGPWCHVYWDNVDAHPDAPNDITTDCGQGTGDYSGFVAETAAAGFIRVVKPNDAQCISFNPPPATVTGGTGYPTSVTMENIGHNTWTNASNYNLGSQDPQDNSYWGLNRSPVTQNISPYQQTTFSINATAPQSSGTYNFSWQMVQDGVEWFGDKCPASAYAVTVNPNISAPLIQGINIHNNGGVAAAFQTSGLGSNQGGVGYFNPLSITLNATAGKNMGVETPATYYMAFYDKSGGAITSSFLNTITSRLSNPINGVLLAYDKTGTRCGGGSFCVYDKGSWVNISGTGPLGYQISNSIGVPLYTVFPGNLQSYNAALQWRLNFDKNFGTKQMFTAGYVLDTNNQSVYTSGGDINPSTQ